MRCTPRWHARGLRRRGARARLARPHPARAAAERARAAPSRAATLGDIDAVAYTQGPGLAGALLVGASVAQRPRATRSACPAIGIHHLEGHLLSPLLADPAAGVPVRRAAGLRRPHAADARRRRRPLRAARRDAGRRGRRGIRQDREAAGPGLSRRARARRSSPKPATPGRFTLPRPMIAQRRPRFQLQRAEDRGADAGAQAAARAPRLTHARADLARAVPGGGRRRAGREMRWRRWSAPG